MCSNEELPEGNRIKLNKLLKESVFDQNYVQTSLYLKKGADASLRVNTDAGNLLHHTRDPGIASLLISKGAKVDARNRFRLTPLLLAVKERNYELVEVLLKHKADVNCCDKNYKNTPLNIAVLEGDVKFVKLLLKYGSVVNDQTNSFSNTPLHLALRLQNINVEIINLLLENRADVNILNIHEESPINFAVRNRRCPLHVIKKLITHGALINSKDSKGISLLQYALSDDNYEVIKLLLKHGAEIVSYNSDGLNVLQYYIKCGHAKLKIVKCLLKHSCTSEAVEGCYANTLSSNGASPLFMAFYCAIGIDMGIIKELLHYNADPHHFDVTKGSTMFEETLRLAARLVVAPKLQEVEDDFYSIKDITERLKQVMNWLIKYSAIKSKDNVCFMRNKLKDKYYFENFLNECLAELPLIEQALGIPLNEFLKPVSN